MRLTIIDIPFVAISLINALYAAFVFIFVLISFATGEWYRVSNDPIRAVFFLVIVFAPLVILAVPKLQRDEAGDQLLSSMLELQRRVRVFPVAYHVICFAVLAGVVILVNGLLVTTISERIRWMSAGPMPFYAWDPPLPNQIGTMLAFIIPPDWLSAPMEAASLGVLYVFLLAVAGLRTHWLVPILLSAALFEFPETVRWLGLGHFEFAAAVFGGIGLILLAEGRFVAASLGILAACLLKNTGAIFAITGIIVLASRLTVVRSDFQRVPWLIIAVAGFVALSENFGVLYYIFSIRGGAEYLFSFKDPSLQFRYFAEFYPVLFGLAAVGFLIGVIKRDGVALRAGGLLVLLIAVRSLLVAGGGEYYDLFAFPLAIFLAFRGLHLVIDKVSPAFGTLAAVAMMAFVIPSMVAVWQAWSVDTLNKIYGRWNFLVAAVTTHLSPGALFFQRGISVIPYLPVAIARETTFLGIGERNIEGFTTSLTQAVQAGRCVVVISPTGYLVSDDQLRAVGMNAAPAIVSVPGYRAFSANCGDWQTNEQG